MYVLMYSVMITGKSYILKSPFITNSKNFKSFVRSAQEAQAAFRLFYRRQYVDAPECYIIPYFMLQEKVSDNREARLCFLDGTFSHFVVIGGKSVNSLKHYCATDLIDFASSVFLLLKDEPTFILDGLVRIDIFEDDDERLVVNELESLDARYTASREFDAKVASFLMDYWERHIYMAINILFSK